MKRKLVSLIFLGLSISCFGQSHIATWDFNSAVNDAATITGTSSPNIGIGNAFSIGGSTSTFSSGNPNDLNLTDNSGLNTTTYPAQGTNQKTAGLRFDVSTVGFNKVVLEFYQRLSNTAANTWVLQYTLDNSGLSTGGNIVWLDATTYTFTPAATGTGDIWYLRKFDFSAISGLNNNTNAGFRIVSAFDPTTGTYLAARSTSTYSGGGTSRFDLVSFKEAEGIASIAAASNYQIVTEAVGNVIIPITFANANNAAAKVVFELSAYSSGTLVGDFNWASTDTLTIPAEFNGLMNFPININNDSQAEKTESIILKLKSFKNALISTTDYYQIIYVKDNDYVAPIATNELNMTLLTSFSTGPTLANSAEIVVYDSSTYRLYSVNSIGAKLDIIDFSIPSSPILINSVNISSYGNINSVTAHNGVVAMAIENSNPQLNGKIVFVDQNGVFISQVEAGAMPDMITFNKDFTKILTANEGEPNSTYTLDPEGSVTIVDLTSGYAALTNANATTISLTQFNGQASALKAQGIRIFSTSASVAQDLEPEYITISDDNTKAYVSLQENNAMLVIDMITNTISEIRPLGYSNYSSGNAMDASDQTGQVLITSLPVKGAYMPDAMAYSTVNGQGYIFTANEGDSREFGSVVDANRISTLTLDPIVFTDQLILKNNRFAGRLNGLKYSGDTDNDGDLDEIHVMGGRSFSIWNATTGSLVFDSKDLIEQIVAAHPVYGAIFNASNSIGNPSLKNRSDDKGPEPEGVTTAVINGDHYLFVSLERVGGAMIFNINNPTSPVYVGYKNNRSINSSGPDLGAEGMIYISADASPNGNSMLILANEVSSTLSIYQLNTCAEIAGAEISADTTILCEGENTLFEIVGSAGTSIQWYLNNQIVSGAISNNLVVNQSGQYKVFIQSALYACQDTSTAVQLVVNPLPVVSALINDTTICEGELITLTGQGANSYTWSNGVLNTIAFAPSVSLNYSVVGVDANGCSNSDSVAIVVNPLPLVVANVTDTIICEGQNNIFTGSGAQTYSWNNSIIDGLPAVLTSSATIGLVGIDANGCSNIDSVAIVVNPLPLVVANVTDTIICEGQNVIFTGSGAQTYSWNNSIIDSFPAVLTSSATFELVGIDANGCSNADSVAVVVNPLPDISLGSDTSACVYNAPINLNVPGIYSVYNWNTGETTSSIQVDQSGTYVVSVTSESGCSDSDTIVVIIDPCLGINELTSEMRLYPNPTNGIFFITFGKVLNKGEIQLKDGEGRLLQKLSVEGEDAYIMDLTSFSRGIYWVTFINENSTQQMRIIKD